MKKALIVYCIGALVIVVLQGMTLTPREVTNTVCIVLAIVSLSFWSGIYLKNFFSKYPWTIIAVLAVVWLLGLFLGSMVSNMSVRSRASAVAHQRASTNEVLEVDATKIMLEEK